MIAANSIAGVVLAGGQSRRMGGKDKSWIDIGGTPAIARACTRLAPQVAHLAINTNADPEPFQALEYPILADTLKDFPGPLAGVLTAMRWAHSLDNVTHIVTAATDTPFFPTDFVERLASEATGPENIVMAKSAGWVHPVFALWPIRLANALEAYLTVENERKILMFSERYDNRMVEFEDTLDPFFNVNTPEDLTVAQTRLVETEANSKQGQP
ncbi:MAG: molybdenum cofactor guanylyltransferase MobA [Pseudomonadota bacterium]